MAHYLVRARAHKLDELRTLLDSGRVRSMQPFGHELDSCLNAARVDTDGMVVWEEQCFCSPPLAQERAVLDQYFTDLTTDRLKAGEGWAQIANLPPLWSGQS